MARITTRWQFTFVSGANVSITEEAVLNARPAPAPNTFANWDW